MRYNNAMSVKTILIEPNERLHLRVEGSAQLSLYSDARLGYQEIPIKTTEWYAPGVGLVKLVREEPLDTEVFEGGTITLALARFEE